MRKNLLFNRIISLALVIALYTSMSMGAYAEADDEPQSTQTSEEAAREPVTETVASESAPAEAPAATESEAETSVVEESEPAEIAEEELPDGDDTSEIVSNNLDSIDDIEEIEDYHNPAALEAIHTENSDEVITDELEELQEELIEEPEVEEECEHETVYISNADGTHTVNCNKCKDFEEYTESCEFDDNGKCIYCGFTRKKDPILEYEDGDVSITVSGDIPENADLKVTPIKDNDETRGQYNETVNKLKEKSEERESDIVGFLAYDIKFVDIDTDEEKEPDGDVTVSMEYKGSVNPVNEEAIANAETIDVEMMHIDGETSKLENLTEDGNASIATEGIAEVKAVSFTNDSFSTYILTWSGTYSKEVTVHLNNKLINGDVLEDLGESEPLTVTEGSESVIISEIADELDDYRFLKATYLESGKEQEIDKWDYKKTTGSFLSSTHYYLNLEKDNTEVAQVEFSSTKEITINIYYVEAVNLEISKYATGAAARDTETSYTFTIKDANDTPIADATYKIDETVTATDATGGFSLKSGETACFMNLPEGDYTIIETGNTGESYNLINDFTTRIFVEEEADPSKSIAAKAEDARDITVSLNSEEVRKVKFQNCITTTFVADYKDSSVEKFVEDIRDENGNSTDKYSITFKFKGPEETVQTIINQVETHEEVSDINVDIILLIDKSGSMEDKDSGQTKTRIQLVKSAVDSMIDELARKNDINAKWEVIDFATTAKVVSNGWVTTDNVKSCVTTSISKSSGSGIGRGTNYQAGMNLAQTEFTSKQAEVDRPNAQKIVIFLTDGEPTYYMNGSTVAGNGAYFTSQVESASYTAAENLQCDYFYAIGIGLGSVQYYKYENGKYTKTNQYIPGETIITNIKNHSPAADSNKAAYNIRITDVSQTLNNLAGTISTITTGNEVTTETKYFAENVVMSDTLSGNVEVQKDSIFYINVTKDGIDVATSDEAWVNGHIDGNGMMTNPAEFVLPDGTVLTATYDGVSKTAQLSFPSGYVLNEGYEYSVKLFVEPSDAAYDYYFENNQYPDVGDDKTDHFRNAPNLISSGLPGFYTNGAANVNYTFKGGSVTENFPRPVIPVHFKNVWELYKINGEGAGLEGAEFRLEETGVEAGTASAYTGTSIISEGAEGLVQWELSEVETIIPGKTYRLTEIKAPSGYIRSEEYWIVALSDENVPTVTKVSGDGITQEAYTIIPERNGRYITYRFNYVNLLVYTLPDTGGEGIFKSTMLGILLMMTAVALYYMNRRKLRRVVR